MFYVEKSLLCVIYFIFGHLVTIYVHTHVDEQTVGLLGTSVTR
jgi:hypothetical protein